MDLFAGIYLFRTLSADQRAWIARLSTAQMHMAGSIVFRQGDKASAMYVIKKGLVVIRHRNRGSEEIEVARLVRGSHFGEISLLSGDPRTATAETMESSELLLLGYDKLRKLLEDQPIIGTTVYKAMAGLLSGRLASTTTDDLTFVPEKLRVRA